MIMEGTINNIGKVAEGNNQLLPLEISQKHLHCINICECAARSISILHRQFIVFWNKINLALQLTVQTSNHATYSRILKFIFV